MFSAITMNRRGRPVETHEVVVETIAATTTKTGLTIQAALDTTTYQRGIKITDKEMKAFEAAQLELHGVRRAGQRHDTPEPDGVISAWALTRADEMKAEALKAPEVGAEWDRT